MVSPVVPSCTPITLRPGRLAADKYGFRAAAGGKASSKPRASSIAAAFLIIFMVSLL
jgi:hypothetical protein